VFYRTAAYFVVGEDKKNVRSATQMYNSGGYYLQDSSSGQITTEFYRPGEDDGWVQESINLSTAESLVAMDIIHSRNKSHISLFYIILFVEPAALSTAPVEPLATTENQMPTIPVIQRTPLETTQSLY